MENFDFKDFGCNVFDDEVMRGLLPKDTYKALKHTIDEGAELDSSVAGIVANAMKVWAMENGATHYTHWFQPLTGGTAEKHDSFLSFDKAGHPITEFSGKTLIKGEPDASSFPNGGLRQTCEARGYTAWDCTSPAFLKSDGTGGVTLCIPTVFLSYTGVALDKKTPLLRSEQAINREAKRILLLFGEDDVKKVYSTVGAEQEYFLINLEDFNKRKDLIFTERTLFGAPAPKGQELDDHYFGVLKERVAAFMKELDAELWKLGIYSKTKHNEVAPCQHEMAPIFATVNVANDNNQLTMELMKTVARRHGFACLLHEKPFAGINGSGKHDNWALSTDTGINLLEPGDTPMDNYRFLLFLCATIEAVDNHADLLRASAASAGNDHRLGANEAPPSIISIFVGDDLQQVLTAIETGRGVKEFRSKMDLGVSILPKLSKDATDRNRTSPFAFTGNKFEFRMVGSAQSIAGPNTVLNTIVAESLAGIADRLENAKDLNKEVMAIVKSIIKKHKRIIFNGNGYSNEWVEEAEKRGLPNLRTSVDAFPAYTTARSVAMFERFGVYSKEELTARLEVKMEKYAKKINIEALTMIEMAKRDILPAVLKAKDKLAAMVNHLTAAGIEPKVEREMLATYASYVGKFYRAIGNLEKATTKAERISDVEKQAREFCNKVIPLMNDLRKYADEMEKITDRSLWPFPTYSDILFY